MDRLPKVMSDCRSSLQKNRKHSVVPTQPVTNRARADLVAHAGAKHRQACTGDRGMQGMNAFGGHNIQAGTKLSSGSSRGEPLSFADSSDFLSFELSGSLGAGLVETSVFFDLS